MNMPTNFKCKFNTLLNFIIMVDKLLSFLTKAKKNTLFQGMVILFSGTVIAQLVSVLSLPILQLFYDPEEFAVLNTFTSLTILISSLATLKLEYAIVPVRSDWEARRIAVTSTFFVAVISLLSIMLLLIAPSILLPAKMANYTILFSICLPLAIFIVANNEIILYWQNRKGQFKRMSVGKVYNSVSMEGSRFLSIFLNGNFPGLVVGRILGYFINLLYNLHSLGFKKLIGLLKLLRWGTIKSVLIKYRSFPLFTMPNVLLNNLTSYLFLFMFITSYDSREAGLVTIANQYIALPLGLIAGSLSQVFFKHISSIGKNEELLRVYKYYALRLAVLGICLVIIILLIPNNLPQYLLGQKWSGLMPYIKITVVWQSIAFVSSALSFIYTRLMILNVLFFFSLIQLILVVASLKLSTLLSLSAFECFSLYTIIQSGYYGITIFATLHLIKRTHLQT
jgi:O-antigen/teichoic acid export membrane protein